MLQQHGVDLPARTRSSTGLHHARCSTRCAEHVPWRPGARELLAELRGSRRPDGARHDVDPPHGPASWSTRSASTRFDAVVAGDEVEHSKPHPEAYLRGAELLGVDVADCVAIEDSVPGLASAMAAGAVALGVEHAAPLADDSGYVRRDTLVGVAPGRPARACTPRADAPRDAHDLRLLTARRRGAAPPAPRPRSGPDREQHPP